MHAKFLDYFKIVDVIPVQNIRDAVRYYDGTYGWYNNTPYVIGELCSGEHFKLHSVIDDDCISVPYGEFQVLLPVPVYVGSEYNFGIYSGRDTRRGYEADSTRDRYIAHLYKTGDVCSLPSVLSVKNITTIDREYCIYAGRLYARLNAAVLLHCGRPVGLVKDAQVITSKVHADALKDKLSGEYNVITDDCAD